MNEPNFEKTAEQVAAFQKMWADSMSKIMQGAFAVIPVDTTAAGDAFCGVLVAGLSQGMGLPDALRQANAAGALACTKPGAQSSIPTHAELQSFLRNHGGSAGVS